MIGIEIVGNRADQDQRTRRIDTRNMRSTKEMMTRRDMRGRVEINDVLCFAI